ncbi:hypothetical protein OAA06_01285 [bacterium]|nr:hypothetical protein [bacterium]
MYFTMAFTNCVIDKFLPEHKGLDFGSSSGPFILSILTNKGYTVGAMRSILFFQ